MCTAITELCSFFRNLCARTIIISDLDRLQSEMMSYFLSSTHEEDYFIDLDELDNADG